MKIKAGSKSAEQKETEKEIIFYVKGKKILIYFISSCFIETKEISNSLNAYKSFIYKKNRITLVSQNLENF